MTKDQDIKDSAEMHYADEYNQDDSYEKIEQIHLNKCYEAMKSAEIELIKEMQQPYDDPVQLKERWWKRVWKWFSA